VVRVESYGPSTRVGVAALIEEYEFLRSDGESAASSGMEPSWNFTR